MDAKRPLALLRAAKLCQHIESKIAPLGYHVALTGSTLTGDNDHVPGDLDLILYPHCDNSKEVPFKSVPQLLAAIGIKDYNAARDDYQRTVYRTKAKDGGKVDFWMLIDDQP